MIQWIALRGDSCGLDGVKSSILKMCCEQLNYKFTFIFNLSLFSHSIPLSWKCSEIIPIPKKSKVNEMNDLRPVALTSVTMKCLERLILKELSQVLYNTKGLYSLHIDPKGVLKMPLLFFLDNIYRHIEIPRNYCRILFVDFPQLLILYSHIFCTLNF